MKMIEFLYFEGCPSYEETLRNLKEILAEENIDANLNLIAIRSPEESESKGFYGSPSIRIDGIDLEAMTGKYSYSCRIYKIEGQTTGVPTKEYIRKRLLDIIS
jgi:hypothetical protein